MGTLTFSSKVVFRTIARLYRLHYAEFEALYDADDAIGPHNSGCACERALDYCIEKVAKSFGIDLEYLTELYGDWQVHCMSRAQNMGYWL